MNKLRNEEILKKLGNRLFELRTSKNLTLESLAYSADMEISQVHRIEKGKINPTYTTLMALAKGLEIKLATLVDFN